MYVKLWNAFHANNHYFQIVENELQISEIYFLISGNEFQVSEIQLTFLYLKMNFQYQKMILLILKI